MIDKNPTQVTEHYCFLLYTLITPSNNSSGQGACLAVSKTYIALTKWRTIYPFSQGVFYCFTPGFTYDNMQGYLNLYSSFCEPAILSSSSDSWYCFCSQKVFSWGINLHRNKFSREQFAAFTPSTLLLAQSLEKNNLRGSLKI